MPFVVTSCAFKIHSASGPGQGKLVPISICRFLAGLLHVMAENVVTDTHMHRQTVTLAAHACRGLINGS